MEKAAQYASAKIDELGRLLSGHSVLIPILRNILPGIGQELKNLIPQATEPGMMDDGTLSLASIIIASAKGSVTPKFVSIAETIPACH